ncbi:MAG: hypothetical protein J2P23_07175 [Microlunatus sp.]|nr:hypothetical protein [Microlunatus sp.]
MIFARGPGTTMGGTTDNGDAAHDRPVDRPGDDHALIKSRTRSMITSW